MLLVSWEFPPLVVGGLGRHVGALASELAALGHDVRVLARGNQTTTEETVERHGNGELRVTRAAADGLDIDFTAESILAWTQAFEHSLIRAGLPLISHWRPDVIHAHDWLVAQTARTLHELSGAPLVVTMHATEHGRQQGWLAEPVQRSIHSVERWLAQCAAAVIVCSRFMANEVTALFQLSPEQVTVIGNGTDPVAWSVKRQPSSTTRATWPLLVFAGRLVHEKGLQELIKALPLLRDNYPRLRLIVAGTGQLLADQQDRAVRYGVADFLDWRGFVSDADLAQLFADADVVVVPSLYEPFGLVALEAQLAGAPVAVSNTGGLAELVEPGVTGARFTPQSPATIAEAIRGLLEDPTGTRAMADRARHRAKAEFGWDVIARRTVRLYGQVLDQARPTNRC